MPTEDDLRGDRLHLLPCRPTLWLGVPYEALLAMILAYACGLVLFGSLVTGLCVFLIVFFLLRAVIAADFNAISVALCYLRTKFVAQRSMVWMGVTFDPLFGQRRR